MGATLADIPAWIRITNSWVDPKTKEPKYRDAFDKDQKGSKSRETLIDKKVIKEVLKLRYDKKYSYRKIAQKIKIDRTKAVYIVGKYGKKKKKGKKNGK